MRRIKSSLTRWRINASCSSSHVYNSNEGIETLNNEAKTLDEGTISGEQRGFLYSLVIGMVTSMLYIS